MTLAEVYEWIRLNTNLMQDAMLLDFQCLEFCIKHGILKETSDGCFEKCND